MLTKIRKMEMKRWIKEHLRISALPMMPMILVERYELNWWQIANNCDFDICTLVRAISTSNGSVSVQKCYLENKMLPLRICCSFEESFRLDFFLNIVLQIIKWQAFNQTSKQNAVQKANDYNSSFALKSIFTKVVIEMQSIHN